MQTLPSPEPVNIKAIHLTFFILIHFAQTFSTMLFRIFFLLAVISRIAHALSPVPEGFPTTWNGDRYFQSSCQVIQTPPKWLDGYFFCQLSASYGDRSTPQGQHVDHMFDAMGGLAVFRLSSEEVTYTGAYYPTRAYKIWNFNDRDFAKSSIAWSPAFARKNESACKIWEKVTTENDFPPPNVDFWKIKNSIIGGTERYQVGMTFDVDRVDNFHLYPFKEATPMMTGQPLIPIHMPIHERMDPETNLLWATVSALNISSRPPSLHQVLFTVDEEGVRRVEGVFDFSSQFDPSKCGQDGWYQANEDDFLPRNMHSMTSTKNYVIIPLTSAVLNPCILFQGKSGGYVDYSMLYRFDAKAKITFLIFDKNKKEFLPPIEYKGKPGWISHQFNAYESSDQILLADMILYDDYAYDALFAEKLLADSSATAHVYRFTLNLKAGTAESRSLMPEDPVAIEFPQFNHRFEGKPYKYGYAITHLYMSGNEIVKIDMDDPSGAKNKIFKPPGDSIALSEPYFVQKPGSTQEDDGLIVSRGLDTSINKARVYVLDAKSMEKVGEILAPTDIPFGFHERFYLKESFQMKADQKDRHSEL